MKAAIETVVGSSSQADTVTVGLDDSVGAHPNQGTYAENSSATISYEVYVSINENGDGPNSQGLGGLAVDIVTDTGIQQPTLSMSKTSSAMYAYAANDVLWSGGKSPTMIGGFGFNGVTAIGNQNANIGNVVGAGLQLKVQWDADVASGTAGLQPQSLHNVGFGTPPGTDVGGATAPASDARSKWYVLKGEVNVPDDAGTYHASVDVQSLSLIRSDVDLNQDQTGGYLIGLDKNGDGLSEGSFSFTVSGS